MEKGSVYTTRGNEENISLTLRSHDPQQTWGDMGLRVNKSYLSFYGERWQLFQPAGNIL